MLSKIMLSNQSFKAYSRYVEQILIDVNDEIVHSKEKSFVDALLRLQRNEYSYHLEGFLQTIVNFLYFKDEAYLQSYLCWRYSFYRSYKISSEFLYQENALIQKITKLYVQLPFLRELETIHSYISDFYTLLGSDNSWKKREPLSKEAQKVYELLLAGDSDAFEMEIVEHIDGLESFCHYFTTTLSAVLRHIGEEWKYGAIKVAQEHRMSALIKDLLLKHMQGLERKPARVERFFLSCVSGEDHTLGLEISRKILEHLGYEVVVLGSKFVEQDLINALYEFQPDYILFIATLPTNLIQLAHNIKSIQRATLPKHPRCYVAGAAIKTLTNAQLSLECDGVFDTFVSFYDSFI